MDNNNKTKLRILLATDLHMNFDNLNALGKYITNSKEQLDYILCNGDIANFDPMEADQMEKVFVCEGEMSTCLMILENIHFNVIYVPGNHDAKTTLLNAPDKYPRLTSFSRNAHRQTLRIGEDLVLMGLGGSLPGYRGDKQVWVGYPYASDEELGKDLDATWDESVASGAIRETDSVLLMTHVGPDSSTTTLDRLDLELDPVRSGSKALDRFIAQHNDQIFLNTHGHTHFSAGMSTHRKTQIINAGPLKFAKFALVTVEKTINRGWQVKSAEFKVL